MMIENPFEPPENEERSDTSTTDYSPRLGIVALLSVVALISAGSVKTIPGGPFISLTGDVLPFAAAVSALWLLPRIVSRARLMTKLVGLAFGIIATVALLAVVAGVIGFWLRPAARGDLFGF